MSVSTDTEVDSLEATMEFNVETYVGMNMGTTWKKILIEIWKYKINKKVSLPDSHLYF